MPLNLEIGWLEIITDSKSKGHKPQKQYLLE